MTRKRLPIRELAMVRDPKKYGPGFDATFGRKETCGDCKMHGKCLFQPQIVQCTPEGGDWRAVEDAHPDPDARCCEHFEERDYEVTHIGY